MSDETLIRMANQIADFFTPYTEEEAVAGIAGHIKSFWEPRMREGLAKIVASGGEGLKPQVLEAAKRL